MLCAILDRHRETKKTTKSATSIFIFFSSLDKTAKTKFGMDF